LYKTHVIKKLNPYAIKNQEAIEAEVRLERKFKPGYKL
jgi:hypothetical protein